MGERVKYAEQNRYFSVFVFKVWIKQQVWYGISLGSDREGKWVCFEFSDSNALCYGLFNVMTNALTHW